jgi:predicted ABC-type ATPase
MEQEYTQTKLPEIIVFAGPNGSGKSTITKMANIIEPYINADDIKRTIHCTDLEAAERAEELRYKSINTLHSFTFETVLSTERNLNLLKQAKDKGFFIRCIYVLTADPTINITRVLVRKSAGGHDVPQEKIITRYYKALKLIPELVNVCDILHIYDNSDTPFRIFKKRKNNCFYWDNAFWSLDAIHKLVNCASSL